MNRIHILTYLFVLLSTFGTKAYAYDIAVANADGVTIYYNYSADGTELTVTSSGWASYTGTIVIPEEVNYMTRTRKVTSIGDYAFSGCGSLTSVTIPNSVTSIGNYAFYGCYSLTGDSNSGDETPTPPDNAKGDGTQANPFNVIAAITYTKAIPADTKSEIDIYIKGKISRIANNGTFAQSGLYGNASFYISDDGTESNEFYVFRTLYLGNVKYSSGTDIKVGDEVIICGKVLYYRGNSPETSANDSYVYSLNGKTKDDGNGGDEGGGEGGEGNDETTETGNNGDFEQWADGLPVNWTTASTAGNATLTQSTIAHGGNYSVQVGGSSSANKRLGYKELKLAAGTYTVKFFAKALAAGGSLRPGFVPVSNGTGSTYTYAADYVDNISTTDWQLVEATLELPSAGTYCFVVMNQKKSSAVDILIDDFTVTLGSQVIIAAGGEINNMKSPVKTSAEPSVLFPNSLTSIGAYAFYNCRALTSVTIPNSVTSIGEYAFCECNSLASVTIGNGVTSIENNTFSGCYGLTSVTIPNSVTSIGKEAFSGCNGLTSVTIPNSVTSLGDGAFYECSSLSSIMIPNSVTSIGGGAFYGCNSMSSIIIPNSVTSIGNGAFFGCDIPKVISKIENPYNIGTNTFSDNTFYNATLYVPVGTIDRYKAAEGWKKFLFIEEGNGDGGSPSKCEKPTISYQNGKLTFRSATEGATCLSTITDSDITSYSSNEVQLGVTYHITVYATKAGYENSDVATATLCWIDVEPSTEGIDGGAATVHALPVLIQSHDGVLTIEGATEGTPISVYNAAGQLVGTATASTGTTTISTTIRNGNVGIVRIGDRAVKVAIK